jgi:AraC family transcriptional regulator
MTTRDEYLARFHRVLAHADRHLEDDLTVDRLSAVAAFSKFHFHRQWVALFGMGVHEYVQLVRLKRASYDLAFRDGRTVLAIALDARYDSPEAFTRAFKKRFGQTPSAFRRQPDWIGWNAGQRRLHHVRRDAMKRGQETEGAPAVEIVSFPETRVAMLAHRGDPRTLGDSIRRFIAWRRENDATPRSSATFNVLYNDPETTPPDEFRTDLCAATRADVAENPHGVVAALIPGGLCAVLRHVGSDDGLGARLAFLYSEWLPQSGYEPRDFPPFVQRVRFFPDVPEHEAVTDVFIPLASRAGVTGR